MSQQTQTLAAACQMRSTAIMVGKGSYVTPYACTAIPMQQICNTITIQPHERNSRNYQHILFLMKVEGKSFDTRTQARTHARKHNMVAYRRSGGTAPSFLTSTIE